MATKSVEVFGLSGAGTGEGAKVAINLHLVRRAAPVAKGTRVYFDKDDSITVTMAFDDFVVRLTRANTPE
jgi:hypothetical protein